MTKKRAPLGTRFFYNYYYSQSSPKTSFTVSTTAIQLLLPETLVNIRDIG